MRAENLKSLVCAIALMGLLIAPLLIIAGAIVGVTLNALTDHQETAKWICGIAFGSSLVLTPIAWKVFTKSHRESSAALVSHAARHVANGQQIVAPEQRRHPRYSFHSSATFVNERASGFLKISDISDGGCRAESKVPLVPGETCQLLIDLPQKNASINVSEALVRWASGHECGLKFLHIDHDGQGWLHTLTNRAVIGDVLQSS